MRCSLTLLLALLFQAACSSDLPADRPAEADAARPMVILVGGAVYSGEDKEPVFVDVGLTGDRISAIGDPILCKTCY